jgi:hypothetical protein
MMFLTSAPRLTSDRVAPSVVSRSTSAAQSAGIPGLQAVDSWDQFSTSTRATRENWIISDTPLQVGIKVTKACVQRKTIATSRKAAQHLLAKRLRQGWIYVVHVIRQPGIRSCRVCAHLCDTACCCTQRNTIAKKLSVIFCACLSRAKRLQRNDVFSRG